MKPKGPDFSDDTHVYTTQSRKRNDRSDCGHCIKPHKQQGNDSNACPQLTQQNQTCLHHRQTDKQTQWIYLSRTSDSDLFNVMEKSISIGSLWLLLRSTCLRMSSSSIAYSRIPGRRFVFVTGGLAEMGKPEGIATVAIIEGGIWRDRVLGNSIRFQAFHIVRSQTYQVHWHTTEKTTLLQLILFVAEVAV